MYRFVLVYASVNEFSWLTLLCNEITDLNNFVIEFSDFIIGLWVLFLFKESGRKVCAIRNQIHQKIALYSYIYQ